MTTLLEKPSIQAAPPAPKPKRSVPTGAIGRWILRVFIVLPFIFVAPEVYQLAFGNREAGVVHITTSTADVFGNGAIICMWLMLAVTPVITMTGWTWHRRLRQNFGCGLFACALADFIIAATLTGNHFRGGLITRIAGHAVTFVGTTAFLLSLPLIMTCTKKAQRWLGPHWHWLHRLTYFLWGAVMLHMLFLFGFGTASSTPGTLMGNGTLSGSFFMNALEISVPLIITRVPAVRNWWTKSRHEHSHLVLRWCFAIALIVPFCLGMTAFIHEFINVGVGAILLHPA
jgi:DMSO/TMAO reductase YedYZ heme-binding membrane subunit